MLKPIPLHKLCTTCCRPAATPWRVYDAQGNIVHGCVDDFHSGALEPRSKSSRWHNRKAAMAIRAAMKRLIA